VVAIGSSKFGESSYSHHTDSSLGISVIDRFTYYTLEFFERHSKRKSQASLFDLFSSYKPKDLLSNVEYRSDLLERPLNKVPLTDFFGAVTHVYFPTHTVHLEYDTSNRYYNTTYALDSMPSEALSQIGKEKVTSM